MAVLMVCEWARNLGNTMVVRKANVLDERRGLYLVDSTVDAKVFSTGLVMESQKEQKLDGGGAAMKVLLLLVVWRVASSDIYKAASMAGWMVFS